MFNLIKKIAPQKDQQPKTLGQLGEEFAQGVYVKRGYRIVAANFFNKKGMRKGEVDFIAKGKGQVVFVEVKTRGRDAGRFGTPADSVNLQKQLKLLKAVKIFLLQNPEYASSKPRIDVCEIVVNDASRLVLVETNPPKYLYAPGVDPLAGIEVQGDGRLRIVLDKSPFSVKILVNAVEDWN